MPPRSKRTWTAPADEEPFSFSSFRTPTQWSEPLQEESFCRQRRVKLLKATPKYLPGDKHRIRPSVHPPAMMPVSVCVFPKFKKLKAATPEQSHTKALKLKQKNADMWVMILSHLHRFSLLYQKTADSRYQDEHVTNILANYNQLSTARHFQIWQHFVDWCEPFGFHPANITTSFLLDFIYEATYQIRKQTYSMKSLIQALKFVASQAEVPKLMDILNTPVINGHVTSTKRPQNPREVFPLPFHVAISFEYYVQDDRRPESSRLILGCYLFMFWTGLRFQDLQRTKPHSISLNDGIIRAICELSKSGQPQPAACIACGLSSDSFCTGWGYAWYDLIKDWINVTTSSSPSFQMDFIFPEVQGEGFLREVLVPRPMLYSKAASILRHVAKQPFMSPPYTASEVATLTVHSAKSALISAAKQLDLPPHWISEQGHHRGKRTQGDRYSRDDTTYQLLLQKTVIMKTKQGWRPITPQARGGQHPILQRSFLIPTGSIRWPAFLEHFDRLDLSIPMGQEPNFPTSVGSQDPQLCLQDDKASSTKAKLIIDSSSSDSSSSSSEEADKQKNPGPFILNHFTRIAHLAKHKDGKLVPSCGAKFFNEKLYRVSDELPEDYDLCQHKACTSN